MDQSRCLRRFGPPTFYWVLAICVFLFGVVAAWGVGIPIAAFGVALVHLGLLWDHPWIYWPLTSAAFTACLIWFVSWTW